MRTRKEIEDELKVDTNTPSVEIVIAARIRLAVEVLLDIRDTLSKPVEEDGIKIVPSGREDYCGACKKEHGYDCPKDLPELPEEIEIWSKAGMFVVNIENAAKTVNAIIRYLKANT